MKGQLEFCRKPPNQFEESDVVSLEEEEVGAESQADGTLTEQRKSILNFGSQPSEEGDFKVKEYNFTFNESRSSPHLLLHPPSHRLSIPQVDPQVHGGHLSPERRRPPEVRLEHQDGLQALQKVDKVGVGVEIGRREKT